MKRWKKEKEAGNAKPDKKKVPVVKVGVRRKSTVVLWILLLGSVSFGVYKNFTAVDTRTEVVKEVVEMKLLDTNAIENYVKNFAKVYYSWSNDESALEQRSQEVNSYLTEPLQSVNAGMIDESVDNRSVVHDVQIWQVEPAEENEYDVTFSVQQQIISKVQKQVEGKKKKKEVVEEDVSVWQKNAYVVRVHVDDQGNLVIVNNPTVAKVPQKSVYQTKEIQSAGVDTATISEITEFLQTFFMMYPQATEKELLYYVKNEALKPIEGNYTFWEIVNPVFTNEGETVKVSVYVKFYDEAARVPQISQYRLVLEKDDNWQVIGVN